MKSKISFQNQEKSLYLSRSFFFSMNIYEIHFHNTRGETLTLEYLRGKVLLIVNTATQCGLSGQFEDLETLWNTYSHDDFMVLGFPCNQFLNQEPETDETVEQVCKMNFWVTFPLFAKIDVNGDHTHALYSYLKWKKWGILWDEIKWNFTKFLIDREGNVVERYAPTTSPISLKKDIEKLL